MLLVALILLASLLAGLGWLTRARILRRARRAGVRDALLQPNAGGERFSVESVGALPGPAAAYLRRALAPGAPLARSVDIFMSGTLRLGAEWVPFQARQRVCAERGYLWEGRITAARGLGRHGADWLCDDDAGSEYALADWWPMAARRGAELARSAAGRLMVDLVWLPPALTPQRGARWARGDERRAVVTPAGRNSTPVTLVIDPDGRLREASIVRRRVSANGETSLCTYGVSIEQEARVGGFVVPTRLVAAWGIGTDAREDCMRVAVDNIRWL
jgi:hypothetical protein